MIGRKDIETEAGNDRFQDYCKTTERFINSKVFLREDREELVQETIKRVLQKISENENLKVNAGYFLNTAKYVLSEYYRQKTKENKRFQALDNDENESEKPPDSGPQVENYANQNERAIIADCMLECFNECSLNEQILLWRYCFDEKYRLDDEESDSNGNLFRRLLEVIREIRDRFLPFQENYEPITEDVRVRVSRLRRRLKTCLYDCISRMKGFA